MSTNLFARLKRLLPDSPVLVGRVLAHHDDDTSTVLLPTNQGLSSVGDTLGTGSYVRARGTTVPVGSNAFVRDGVIETQAPDADPLVIRIGTVVAPVTPLTFSGPIPDPGLAIGAPFVLNLPGYWSGGTQPYTWAVTTGALPAGLTLNEATGTVSGTPTTATAAAGVVFTATDAAGATAASNSITMQVLDQLIVDCPFDGTDGQTAGIPNNGWAGGTFALTGAAASLSTDHPFSGATSLAFLPAVSSGVSRATINGWTYFIPGRHAATLRAKAYVATGSDAPSGSPSMEAFFGSVSLQGTRVTDGGLTPFALAISLFTATGSRQLQVAFQANSQGLGPGLFATDLTRNEYHDLAVSVDASGVATAFVDGSPVASEFVGPLDDLVISKVEVYHEQAYGVSPVYWDRLQALIDFAYTGPFTPAP